MKYFITGTGTDVGKTYVAALLMRQNNWRALKPVSSGSNDEDILGCTPLYKFQTPTAPHYAARIENIKIDFTRIVDFCKTSGADIVEGAGGIMSPLTETHTNFDLIKALGAPVILVAGNYLGTISHTLTALKLLEGMEVKLILNEIQPTNLDENAASIKTFSGHKVIILQKGAAEINLK